MIVQSPRTERYQTIDALRGIAALAVAVYHLFTPAFSGTDGYLKTIVGLGAHYGYLGVPLFFVISGFVIASTVPSDKVTYRFVGKFAIKRSIRLDPPYWISIAIDLTLLWATIHIFNQATKDFPSPTTILAHLFYLQDLLRLEQISTIYWTLCLEIQFYLFFVLIFAMAGSLRNHRRTAAISAPFVQIAFSFSLAYSLLILAGVLKTPLHGLFISNWYLFMLGAACQMADGVRIKPTSFFTFAALVCIAVGIKWSSSGTINYYALTGVAASTFVYSAKRKEKLSIWLNYRPLLFLGSISYSLYLFHAIVGERFIGFCKLLLSKLGIPVTTEWQAALLFISALSITILFSFAIYKLVEKPSMLLSKKIKPGRGTKVMDDIQAKQSVARLASS